MTGTIDLPGRRVGAVCLMELVERAEGTLNVRVQLFRNREGEFHLSGYARDSGTKLYDFRCSTVGAAERWLRDLIGTAACLPPA